MVVKNPPANAEDGEMCIRSLGPIPGSKRWPGGENGNRLQILVRKIPWTEEPGGTPLSTRTHHRRK